MKHIRRTSDIVKQILEEHKMARNSDDFLYIRVCEKINPSIMNLPFKTVLFFRKNYGLPPFESVRRARQKIQNQFPELCGNSDVEAQRKENECVVRDYSREVHV